MAQTTTSSSAAGSSCVRGRVGAVLTAFTIAWTTSLICYLAFNILCPAKIGAGADAPVKWPLLAAAGFYVFAAAANLFNAWFLKLYWRKLTPGTSRRTPFDAVVCSLVPVVNAVFYRSIWRGGLEAGLKSLAARGIDRPDLALSPATSRLCGICADAVWVSFAAGAGLGLALFGVETCLWIFMILPFAFVGAPLYIFHGVQDLLTNGLAPHLGDGSSGALMIGAAVAYGVWILASAAWQPLRVVQLRRMAAIADALDAASGPAPEKTEK